MDRRRSFVTMLVLAVAPAACALLLAGCLGGGGGTAPDALREDMSETEAICTPFSTEPECVGAEAPDASDCPAGSVDDGDGGCVDEGTTEGDEETEDAAARSPSTKSADGDDAAEIAAPRIEEAALANARVGEGWEAAIEADGCIDDCRWTISADESLFLEAQEARAHDMRLKLTARPATPGAFVIRVAVQDTTGEPDEREFALTVEPKAEGEEGPAAGGASPPPADPCAAPLTITAESAEIASTLGGRAPSPSFTAAGGSGEIRWTISSTLVGDGEKDVSALWKGCDDGPTCDLVRVGRRMTYEDVSLPVEGLKASEELHEIIRATASDPKCGGTAKAEVALTVAYPDFEKERFSDLTVTTKDLFAESTEEYDRDDPDDYTRLLIRFYDDRGTEFGYVHYYLEDCTADDGGKRHGCDVPIGLTGKKRAHAKSYGYLKEDGALVKDIGLIRRQTKDPGAAGNDVQILVRRITFRTCYYKATFVPGIIEEMRDCYDGDDDIDDGGFLGFGTCGWEGEQTKKLKEKHFKDRARAMGGDMKVWVRRTKPDYESCRHD